MTKDTEVVNVIAMTGVGNTLSLMIQQWAGGSLILALSALMAPLSPAWIPLALALFLLGLGWNLCFIAGSSLLAARLMHVWWLPTSGQVWANHCSVPPWSQYSSRTRIMW